MTFLAKGKVTGAFPAAGASAYLGLVHKILVAPDPVTTGFVSIMQGANVVRKFNISAPSGSNDSTFKISCEQGNAIDPTQFSISQTVGGEGAFVSYVIS